MTERQVSILLWAVTAAIILFLSVLAVYAQEQPAYPCPPAAKACKVLVLTPDEEQTLTGSEMIFDHAQWANQAKFSALIAAWKEKLRQAPAGKVVPRPEEDLKK